MTEPERSDAFDLARFVAAQDLVIDRVRAELAGGRKTTHWMWFVFPQLAGLGSSPMAQRYAIRSRSEAVAYLEHKVLGARLRDCTSLVNGVEGRSAREILSTPDDMKFHSCMTLFSRISPTDEVFRDALKKYFAGRLDERTLALLD